jgi:hypothetical protein
MNNLALLSALVRIRHTLDQAYEARIAPLVTGRAAESSTVLLHRLASEPGLRGAIDSGCRDWIGSDHFPLMSPQIAVLFYDRFVEGLSFGEHIADEDCPTISEARALEFLLIEHWQSGGSTSWAELLRSQLGEDKP